jgi:thiamine-phosphate pyrophosphorylase
LPNVPKLSEPIFCYVTDGAGFPPSERHVRIVENARSAISAGANWVQIREKDLDTRELLALTREIVIVAGCVARVIVNDRADVALAANAGGVHLGGRSVPTSEVTRWIARSGVSARLDFFTGVSCHSVNEARAAEKAGASYVVFGPVYRTPSKLGFGAPHGVERLAEVCEAVGIPVVAIGGMDAENAADCFAAGAAGVAAIRMFQDARDAAALRGRLQAASKEWRSRPDLPDRAS